MNQPTREEFEALKEEVRQLREQRTEEIKITRVEVASADVLNKLKALEAGQQEISQKQDEQWTSIKKEFVSIEERQKRQDDVLFVHSKHISSLHEEMKGARADILQIKDSQADLRDSFNKMKNDISRIEATMATKEDISALQKNQDEQHDMLRQVLRLLGQKD